MTSSFIFDGIRRLIAEALMAEAMNREFVSVEYFRFNPGAQSVPIQRL
jgi:hypothetical protein